jgi:hypothetical protein
MLRALLLGSALLATSPAFARVVCTQPGMGTVTIDQSGDQCSVKWVMAANSPNPQVFNTVAGRCTQVYNGETYKLSAVLYAQNAPGVNPLIVITRGTSTDVRSVNVIVNDDMSMNFAQGISCTMK